MKRNYLVRTYWERLYFEEYSQELDDLLLQYFQFKVYNGRQSDTLTYGKQYKSIEYFLYALEVYKETNKNVPNVLGIENRGINLHLDHIIPISYGFKNSINPSIIGGIDNLQIISNRDNARKSNNPTAKGDYLLWKYKPEIKIVQKEHLFEREGISKYYTLSFKAIGKEMIKIEDDGFISIINLNTAEKIKDIKYR